MGTKAAQRVQQSTAQLYTRRPAAADIENREFSVPVAGTPPAKPHAVLVVEHRVFKVSSDVEI